MNQTNSAPTVALSTLTKKQIAILNKPGPFNVYALGTVEVHGKQKAALKRLPRIDGKLHEAAESLLQLKADQGGDYILEDPRTTKVLWTTANSGKN